MNYNPAHPCIKKFSLLQLVEMTISLINCFRKYFKCILFIFRITIGQTVKFFFGCSPLLRKLFFCQVSKIKHICSLPVSVYHLFPAIPVSRQARKILFSAVRLLKITVYPDAVQINFFLSFIRHFRHSFRRIFSQMSIGLHKNEAVALRKTNADIASLNHSDRL